MNANFNEAYRADHLDPVDGQVADFDWPGVLERLDGSEGTVTNSPEQTETIMQLLTLLLADAQGTRINAKAIGMRLIALGWVLNPANYPNSPSLRALAERCAVSPAALAHHSGAISRETGIRNRSQRHAANWRPAERSPLK